MHTKSHSDAAVYVIEESETVRKGAADVLESIDGVRVVGLGSDLSLSVPKIIETNPNVVLAPIRFSNGSSGLDLCTRYRLHTRGQGVVVWADHCSFADAVAAHKQGVSACISRSVTSSELSLVIHQVAAGGQYMRPEVALAIKQDQAQLSIYDLPLDLTGEDIELLRLFGDGVTEREVASMKNQSLRTVTNHKAKLKEKLGVTHNVSLTKLAIRYGLIDINRLD